MDETADVRTWEIKGTREEAEQIVRRLQSSGWTVYHERVPLQGQSGYYCVRATETDDGVVVRRCHSVRWNIFQRELIPFIVECETEGDLLGFLWTHGGHSSLEHLDFGDGEIGFVCHCRAERGYSMAMNITREIADVLDPRVRVLLMRYAQRTRS